MNRPGKNDATLREQIQNHLQTLKIPLTTEQLDEILAAADKSKLSHLQFLQQFLSAPANARRERSIERRIQLARFRDPCTLESFDFAFNNIDRVQIEELASGDFVRRRDHLVFVGASGLGKSHLIQGIGRCCCAHGYNVRYTTSAELLEDLVRASGERNLPRRIRYYRRFDLLIIDEFGFEKLERLEYPEWSSLLYKVIDGRNRRGSTALVTNIDFKLWTDYLGDPPLAMAMLDRVVDGAIIQKVRGKSFRPERGRRRSNNGKPASENGK
jgi:DNA replication protein DnaC